MTIVLSLWMRFGCVLAASMLVNLLCGGVAYLFQQGLRAATPRVQSFISLSLLCVMGLVPVLGFTLSLVPSSRQYLPRWEGDRLPQRPTVPAPDSLAPRGRAPDNVASSLRIEDVSHEKDLPVSRIPWSPLSSSIALDWCPNLLVDALRGFIIFLPALWLFGVVHRYRLFSGVIKDLMRLRLEARQPACEGPERRLFSASRRVVRLLQLSGMPTIGISSRVPSPILVGIARPIILLHPKVASGCKTGQLECIILHEKLHEQRRDNLVMFVQSLLEIVLPFSSVLRGISNWVDTARELRCDQEVVARLSPKRARSYAKTLERIAEMSADLTSTRPRAVLPALASLFAGEKQNELVERIRRILKPDRSRAWRHTLAGVLWGPLALALLLVFGTRSMEFSQDLYAASEAAVPRRAAEMPWVKAEGLERCQALLQNLGEVLKQTPWVRECDVIARQVDAAQKRYREVSETLKRGETDLAWVELGDLHATLAKLALHNVLADQVAGLRLQLARARNGLSAELLARAEAGTDLVRLSHDSEKAWREGDWTTAKWLFSEAYENGRRWLEVNATSDDVTAWRRVKATKQDSQRDDKAGSAHPLRTEGQHDDSRQT